MAGAESLLGTAVVVGDSGHDRHFSRFACKSRDSGDRSYCYCAGKTISPSQICKGARRRAFDQGTRRSLCVDAVGPLRSHARDSWKATRLMPSCRRTRSRTMSVLFWRSEFRSTRNPNSTWLRRRCSPEFPEPSANSPAGITGSILLRSALVEQLTCDLTRNSCPLILGVGPVQSAAAARHRGRPTRGRAMKQGGQERTNTFLCSLASLRENVLLSSSPGRPSKRANPQTRRRVANKKSFVLGECRSLSPWGTVYAKILAIDGSLGALTPILCRARNLKGQTLVWS